MANRGRMPPKRGADKNEEDERKEAAAAGAVAAESAMRGAAAGKNVDPTMMKQRDARHRAELQAQQGQMHFY